VIQANRTISELDFHCSSECVEKDGVIL
jgi:hypothetical protein